MDFRRVIVVITKIQDLSREKYVLPGHTACPGCPETLGLRYVGMALGKDAVLVIPAGCSSIIQGAIPKSSIAMRVVNVPFASSAAVASGIASIRDLLNVNGIPVVWAGDGATADIGFASLSGSAERNDDLIYICVDNEAYMNTGIQRSSLTPYGAWTSTTVTGKREGKKEVPLIMLLHKIPYVATASIAFPLDFINKLRKASTIKGFKYIHLHAPCPTGWRFDPSRTVEVAKLAVEVGAWILFEAEQRKLRLNPPSNVYVDRSKRKPVKDYLSIQGRFKNLSESDLKMFEKLVDDTWELVLKFT
ncbi:MAG: 3-methyl-2-oxobutanoate dehydrogenase subunit beta [Sulfolobales archaeon]